MKATRHQSPLTKSMFLGLVTAILGVLVGITPFGLTVEEEMGLQWLFTLRGTRSPPADVVIIATDRQSAFDLNVPQEPWKWPRSLHGRLVEILSQQGATVIAFDLFFKEPRDPQDDDAFAAAMREAGNVVLFEKIVTPNREISPSNLFITIKPVSQLAQAAAALAPNPLPAIPYRVNQFWLFEPSVDHTATLPLMAFHAHALAIIRDFLGTVKEIDPELALQLQEDRHDVDGKPPWQVMAQTLREYVRTHPTRTAKILEKVEIQDGNPPSLQALLLNSLLKAYSQGDARYLDFYGPPRTITTIPYSCVLGLCQKKQDAQPETLAIDFKGKAVFVGFSGSIQLEQHDRFHTVFTSADGGYVNGVEMAATAFANLLEDRQVWPLRMAFLLLVLTGWGIGLCLIFRLIPFEYHRQSGIQTVLLYVTTGIVVGLTYVGMAYALFTWGGIWLPVIVPLFLQLPFGLFGILFWNYRETSRQRQNIQQALTHYIPAPIAQQLTRSIESIKTTSELVEGICLSTDAARYTALAESLSPEALRTLMNQYYETIFSPVRERGGMVSDVVGDAVLAIWASSTLHDKLRQQACDVAFDIADAVVGFNRQHADCPLPTRMGLHGGRMVLGNVGAIDHYEYRAVGDIVSTATRIEGLNKHLGTRILASALVVEGLEEILTRELGTFQMAGKAQPITVYELIGHMNEATDLHRTMLKTFASGLDAFRQAQWDEAIQAFQASLALSDNDGPSHYYIETCERFKACPPQPGWEGVVMVSDK